MQMTQSVLGQLAHFKISNLFNITLMLMNCGVNSGSSPSISPSQSGWLSFGAHPNLSLMKYSIGKADICSKVCQRDLGIIISTRLSWSKHYDHIPCIFHPSISKLTSINAKNLLYLSLDKISASLLFDHLVASAY